MNKKYDTIFLDWDGVLWDFMQAFCDWFRLDPPKTDKWEFYEELSMTADKFHEELGNLPQDFWEQKKYILPHAQDLVDWAKKNAEKVFVLTVAPEWTASAGKQTLAMTLGLGLRSVVEPTEKTEFAKKGCLLIDDKDSTVIKFAREVSGGRRGGYVWPASYNKGLDHSWYFKKSWLKKPEVEIGVMSKSFNCHWALTDEERNEMIRFGKKWARVEKAPFCPYRSIVDDFSGEITTAVKPLRPQPEPVGEFKDNNLDKETEEMKPTNPKDIAGSSKVPMNSMLSGAVMGEVALALFEGALKYGRHNYRQDGVRASVYYDAVGRHLTAWWEGEDLDEESGLSHITKAIAGLHVLRDCSIRGMCNDDRPPKTADFMKELNDKTKALINKYPDPVPPVLEKGQGECILEAKPYVEDTNSYTEYSDGSRSFTREFQLESGNLGEFEWHRDHYDRRVRLVEGKDWYIQFEGEQPVLITSDFITIKKGEEHRLIAPLGAASRDLKVEVFEYPDGLPEQSGCCGTGGCC